MTVTGSIIAAVCESLLNSSGRFRTLKRVSPVLGAADHVRFTVTSCTVDFEVTMDGCPCLLKIPFGPEAEKFTRAALRATEARHPFIAPWRYYREELLIFTGHGGMPSRTDVLVETLPGGAPLRGFIRTHLHSAGLRSIRDVLLSLSRMLRDMDNAGIVHGHIRPENIIVDNGKVCLTGYIHSCDRKAANDCEALLSIALLSYITACEPSLFPLLWRRHAREDMDSLLQSLRIQMQFHRNERLLEATETLLRHGAYDALPTESLLRDIASAPFAHMDLFKGLLSERGDAPAIDRAHDLTVRYDAGEDLSTAIEFSKCDYIGDMAENRIRYRMGNHWGFADSSGRQLCSTKFTAAGDFYEGRAAVATAEGCGLLCKDGSYIMKPVYEALEWYGPDNVAAASRDGLWHLYDRMGRQLTIQGYEWMAEPSEGLLVVKRGGSFGYISVSGRPVTQLRFDEAFSFRNGSALVEINGEIYRIDREGKKIK